jgi:hypothetical protein
MAGEGRIRRGLRLVGQSMAFLRERPAMLALPVLSGILVTISAAVVMAAAIELDGDGGWRFVLVAVIGTFPLSALATFFNVAFVAMAADAVEGYEPTVRGGLRVAEDRLGAILGWTLLATGVGLLLAAIQQIPGIGGWVGRIVAAAGSLAWGLATFFVVPIIALHGTGARESVRRSARTIRERWGEAITGDFAIGAVMLLLLMPATVAIGIGAALWGDGAQAAGVPLVAGGVVIGALAFTLSSALTSLFQLFLYRYVVHGAVDGPFAVEDLERAIKPRRPPFWRRFR